MRQLVLIAFTGSLTAALAWAGVDDSRVRQQMVDISRQLGVTCTHCHRVDNLKDGSLEAYKTAAAHLKMVEELNTQKIRGLPKVDCYMCHQGSVHPKFREGMSAEPSKKPTKEPAGPDKH